MQKYDYNSLVEAQMGARDRGYTEEFTWHDEKFMDSSKTKSYEPEDLEIIEFYRFEGMSNPGDESILFVLVANDGKKGYAMSSYGPYADEKFAKFLDKVPQDQGTVPTKNP